MDQAFAVYLPVDRRHALATGAPLLERTQGAALFADISGFTPLTEALTRELGERRGAEELPRQLNLVYDALIREVDRYGGSVIGFAGDAITCWFDSDSGLRATACGLAMQAAMRTFSTIQLPTGGTASLTMKVGVASGAVRRFLVGEPSIQLIDVLAGATLHRMTAAEQMAKKGEVVLEEHTAQPLGEALKIELWRTDEENTRFAVVSGLQAPVEPQPWEGAALGALHPDELRPWLLPTVYERLHAGQGEFLTELRPAVALFLRFGGIDYDTDPSAGQKLDQYIRWVQRLLAEYEGTLLQLTVGEKGSYLYAAFGAPIAHEDDTHRAALTALALRTPPPELDFIRDIQIGLTHGTMRTGAYGGSTRRTYGSLGDDVNLAARLMQYAQPGQIIASQDVQMETETLFTWQALEAIRVKGKSEPIPVFSLLGARHIVPLHLQEPTYILPMVGREAELAAIEEKLTRALQGEGQIVGITAEAGMGKSRLVAEAIRLAQAHGFTSYGGECESFGTNTPYLVWQPIWRAFFGLAVNDLPDEQERHLTRTISLLDPALLPRLPLLAPVLGLPLPDNELTRTFSPELRKTSREMLLVELLKRWARPIGTARPRGALLLILEDCHWLDAASHDLLNAIGRAIWNLPVLIVLAYRPPELEHREAPRVSTLDHFAHLPLTELGEPEMAHLIAQHLRHLYPHEERQPPAALITHLAAHAQGNPFYLEELLNYLHDDEEIDPFEVDEDVQLELPTSLHALILSRMDRLSEPQKVTLKVASVIGRLFRFRWLVGYYPSLGEPVAVRGDLDILSRLELTPLEQPEPELAHLFKHIITREVAYESLPYATRAQLHEQLATYLEAQGEMAVEGYLDLLAYHYALSENQEKAREYLRQAGEAAQAVYANEAAQNYYERLLPLVTEPKKQMELHLRLGEVLELVGEWDEAEAHFQAVLELASTAEEIHTKAQSTLALGKLYRLRGEYDEAQAWLKRAIVQWEAADEPGARSLALAEMGWVALRQREYERAREYLEKSRALYQLHNNPSNLAYALNILGMVVIDQGDYAGAQALFDASLALGRELGDKRGIAAALNNLGIVAMNQGDHALAQSQYEASLALGREIGDQGAIANVLTNLGLAALLQGRSLVAQTLFEECLSLEREMGAQWGITNALLNLGHVAWREGNQAGAQGHYQAGLQLAHEIGEIASVVEGLVGLAALAAHTGNSPLLRRAVCLLGATETLCETLGRRPEPLIQTLYDETLAATRAALSEVEFAGFWADGRAMSLDEVVTLALAEGVEERAFSQHTDQSPSN